MTRPAVVMLHGPDLPVGWHWTRDDDLRLRTMISEGYKLPAIATALGRSQGAVMARKAKLGLSLRSA